MYLSWFISSFVVYILGDHTLQLPPKTRVWKYQNKFWDIVGLKIYPFYSHAQSSGTVLLSSSFQGYLTSEKSDAVPVFNFFEWNLFFPLRACVLFALLIMFTHTTFMTGGVLFSYIFLATYLVLLMWKLMSFRSGNLSFMILSILSSVSSLSGLSIIWIFDFLGWADFLISSLLLFPHPFALIFVDFLNHII